MLVEVLNCFLCSLLVDYDKRSNVFYGLGEKNTWRHIARNLAIDLIKGLSLKRSNLKGKVKIQKVTQKLIFMFYSKSETKCYCLVIGTVIVD